MPQIPGYPPGRPDPYGLAAELERAIKGGQDAKAELERRMDEDYGRLSRSIDRTFEAGAQVEVELRGKIEKLEGRVEVVESDQRVMDEEIGARLARLENAVAQMPAPRLALPKEPTPCYRGRMNTASELRAIAKRPGTPYTLYHRLNDLARAIQVMTK